MFPHRSVLPSTVHHPKRGPPLIDYICKLRQKATSSFFIKKRSRFLEKELNDGDTSKLKFAAIETLLGSKKKQTLPSVFPRVKLANKFNDFFLSKFQNILENIPPVLINKKILASGDFPETSKTLITYM